MTVHRSRKLLDLAHSLNECTNCNRWSEHGLEPAHGNWSDVGKGMSIKSDDGAHAALCRQCHAWVDSGTGMDPTGLYEGTRAGKREMWIRAHLRTFKEYWAREYLKVSA